MRKVAQYLGDGSIQLLDVGWPPLRPEGMLVDVRASLISAGTERTKVEVGRRSLIGKARARPDQMAQVVEKARRDGVRETLAAVRSRLQEPSSLGYACSGVVVAVGERVSGIVPGTRVACAGEGYASHSEVNYVPATLARRVPDGVSFEAAAFTTIGAIALQGVRQADVRLGERVAVIGLGLIGQVTCQLLAASGCEVYGVDISDRMVELARDSGAHDAHRRDSLGDGSDCVISGVDAVVITASAPTSDPIDLAGGLCRDRGRVVVVGAVGIDVPREPYYRKELELRLSRSYGPGRYDTEYEERGLDYPVGYVRWTEHRNMGEVLRLMQRGEFQVEHLISHRFSIEDATKAFDLLADSEVPSLGIVLTYGESAPPVEHEPAATGDSTPTITSGNAVLVGAGSFARKVLVPAAERAGFQITRAISSGGLAGTRVAPTLSDGGLDDALVDPTTELVIIATRHDTHASLAAQALRHGKAVFVEKPPALSVDQLEDLRLARAESGRQLFVGFNRRYAPATRQLVDLRASSLGPAELVITVRAGELPLDHWLNDLEVGGGRLVGEGCHFVDLACWIVGLIPERVSAVASALPSTPLAAAQRFSIIAEFADGSVASVSYGAASSARMPKERVELHCGGASAVVDDFRSVTTFGSGGKRSRRSSARRQDKGHGEQMRQVMRTLRGDVSPTLDPLDTMQTTLACLRSLTTGRTEVAE